jgi:hypothetical protein
VDTPTPDQVRAHSQLVAQKYPPPDADELLEAQIAAYVPVMADLTGRAIGEIPGAPVPDYLEPVALQALALVLERSTSTAKEAKREAGRLRLRSFSAGPYSETYFTPGDVAALKTLDPDQRVHALLWALATEEKRRYWLFIWGGPIEPGAAVQRFNWRGRRVVDQRRSSARSRLGY